MPTLLDLSDETLRIIAGNVHGDSDIPLPSFGAHWENFKSDIHPTVARDYLRLRLTCKRMHRICQLKGLHLRVGSWKDMMKWMSNVPDVVVRGVRRLELRLERPDKENTKLIIPLWSAITTFLSSLTSLEELIIHHLPLCRHHTQHTNLEDLRLPPHDFFPTLSALSIQVPCRYCANTLPMLLVPAAPNLQTLRFCAGYGPLDCGDLLRNFHAVWSMRHPETQSRIKSLIIKLACITFQIVNGTLLAVSRFPSIEKLSLHQYTAYNDLPEAVMEIQEAPMESTDGLAITPRSQRIQHENCAILLLGAIPTLTYIDCMLAIIPHVYTFEKFWEPQLCDRRRSFTEDYQVFSAVRERYDQRSRSSMMNNARALIKLLPRLESGAFWNQDPDNCYEWNRWTWKVDRTQTDLTPVFCHVPIKIAPKFGRNQDGGMDEEDDYGLMDDMDGQ
ncbi:hypothetical protein CI109_104166 [Kwoniella shandongensis]|uniref:Uncharacterized protein n=1 Tax=Kwoniella shandongensis TaxID=1734106 RepID=A0A5M6C191_9TREE|nr:uncharacterized protein CI109_002922 [Kwoniella shandongensis]KAA5528764.1 hypothetical protein CI109_002922 [Kwoniella shandongensis]